MALVLGYQNARHAVVELHVQRLVEAGGGDLAIGESGFARTRQGGDRAVGSDQAQAIVVAVGHDDGAIGQWRDTGRIVEPRRGGRAVGVACLAGTRNRRHLACGRDPADGMVQLVGHPQAPLTVDAHVVGLVEARRAALEQMQAKTAQQGELPEWLARDALDAGKLVPVLPGYTFAQQGIYAVYPDARHVSAKVRTFIDFMRTSVN